MGAAKARVRRPRHWVVGVCLVFIASVWLGSGWWTVGWAIGSWLVGVEGGQFAVVTNRVGQDAGPRMSPNGRGLNWSFRMNAPPGDSYILVPLWFPSLAIASIGIVREVRWRRRKPGPGHCSCGYPIAGLERCPECGEETA